ncbi:hypothetical protein ACP70R_049673 [Stipagrostis hirtigluma subsp. patula]
MSTTTVPAMFAYFLHENRSYLARNSGNDSAFVHFLPPFFKVLVMSRNGLSYEKEAAKMFIGDHFAYSLKNCKLVRGGFG